MYETINKSARPGSRAFCQEPLVKVDSTKSGWAHDNGEHTWDHDAEPVEG